MYILRPAYYNRQIEAVLISPRISERTNRWQYVINTETQYLNLLKKCKYHQVFNIIHCFLIADCFSILRHEHMV